MQSLSAPPRWMAAVGGMFGLIVAMGIGRFAYTPLLPLLQQEYGLSATVAGGLATTNYIGYLLGASLCLVPAVARQRVWIFRVSLLLSVGTTAAMGLSHAPVLWAMLRFLSGLASAGVLVLGSALALEHLAHRGAAGWRGVIFTGVGLGIAFAGAVVLLLDDWLSVRGLWLVLGGASLPLALISWFWLTSHRPITPAATAPASSGRGGSPLLPWLTAAYFCVGLGYVISGTFLVAIVQDNAASATAGTITWIVVGIAAVGSSIAWPALSLRVGVVKALVAAYALQAAGIVLPALSPGLVAAYAGAVFYGGTFMGIVAMTMSLGQQLAPQQSTRTLSLLTVAYGTGQIIGPLLAGVLVDATKSYAVPLVGAAAVVVAGGVLLVIGAGRSSGKMPLVHGSTK